jgi:hypothetical protein
MRYIGNDYEGDMAKIAEDENTKRWWKVGYPTMSEHALTPHSSPMVCKSRSFQVRQVARLDQAGGPKRRRCSGWKVDCNLSIVRTRCNNDRRPSIYMLHV